jgi:hypothetical protein
MYTLPITMIRLLEPFAPLFSKRVFNTPEKRQDYYRRIKLKVEVYQDDEPTLEISGIPVCQNGSTRNSPSR